MQTKGIIAFEFRFHLQGQYSMPFSFPHCEKLVLFYNLNSTEMCINFKKYVIH
jgi:hypothetical protein